MNDAQGKGLRDWANGLTPEQRSRIGHKGGKARAKKLTKARRRQIARMGGLRKSLIHKAKNATIKP